MTVNAIPSMFLFSIIWLTITPEGRATSIRDRWTLLVVMIALSLVSIWVQS
jgi:hypothetical protein